jgi:hypothetical protein
VTQQFALSSKRLELWFLEPTQQTNKLFQLQLLIAKAAAALLTCWRIAERSLRHIRPLFRPHSRAILARAGVHDLPAVIDSCLLSCLVLS